MNKSNIIALFGKKAGTKLTSWLDPCCDAFCVDVRACGGGGGLPITTNLNGGIVATYDQTNNFFGSGIRGAGQIFDTGSGGLNILASVDATAFGESLNSTITGYASLGPGAQASASYSYDTISDEASITLNTKSAVAKVANIVILSDATNSYIEFDLGGGNRYTFPTTTPMAGEVMGYIGPNQLGWVTAGGISIGDTVGGGPVNNAVLLVDNTGDLKTTGNFTYDATTDEFAVGASGNILTVNPTTGVVATTASGISALTAVTSFGTAFKVFTSGGMGQLIQMGDVSGTNNKTVFSVGDTAAPSITALVNGAFQVYGTGMTPVMPIDVNTNVGGVGDVKVYLGDTTGVKNNTFLRIDDATESIQVSKPFRLKGYTVATLPAGTVGDTAYVTDAGTYAFGGAVVGGGANVIPVFHNGVTWIVG